MSNNPYEPTKAPLADKRTLEVSWGHALPVWWSITWRTLVYGILGGFVLGAIAGGLAAASGVPERAELYGMIAGYIVTIPVTMLSVKQAISRHLSTLAREYIQ